MRRIKKRYLLFIKSILRIGVKRKRLRIGEFAYFGIQKKTLGIYKINTYTMAANSGIVFFMSETTANGWIANRVYVGEVSADGRRVTFQGSAPMNYTPALRQGVMDFFIINGQRWTQRRLANRFIRQNPEVDSPAQLLANAFAVGGPILAPPAAAAPPPAAAAAPAPPPPAAAAAAAAPAPPPPAAAAAAAPAGPMAHEFDQEGQLEIAQILMDLQHFRDTQTAEDEGQKQKRPREEGGKRTKRRRPKRKRKSRRK